MTTVNTGAAAAAPITLRPPTFADWVECGDLLSEWGVASRDTPGALKLEMRISPDAVARWFERLSGVKAGVLRDLDFDEARRLIAELRAMVRPIDRADQDPLCLMRAERTQSGVRIALQHPIPGHREDYTAIELRRPKFGDWLDCGDVYVLTGHERIIAGGDTAMESAIDRQSVVRWLETLSGLSMASLGQMTYDDARAAFACLKPLFKEVQSGNSAAPQTSSGSTAA